MAEQTLYRRIDCPRCRGTGQIADARDPYSQAPVVYRTCPNCCGMGTAYEEAGRFETGPAREDKLP